MTQKAINLEDKKVNKTAFYKNKKLYNVTLILKTY